MNRYQRLPNKVTSREPGHQQPEQTSRLAATILRGEVFAPGTSRLGMPKSALPAAMEALRDVGLEARAGDWPAILSGGQRQRVALARALVHRPHLLLLDEPLGALDALTRIEMHALIERLWLENGFTTVLVTHDVQEAIVLADRILVVDEGAIVFDEAVELPRPRVRGSREFAALEDKVLREVLRTAAPR